MERSVYKIVFPSGLFYIGMTKGDIIIRLNAHIKNRYSNKLADYIKEKCYSLYDLNQFTEIIYCGRSAYSFEQSFIYGDRNNPNMLNMRIPKHKPHIDFLVEKGHV